MIYQAHYDTDGTIKGFYLPGLHRDTPTPTIEITAEQHADYFARGQNHKVIDGVWTYVEPEPQVPEVVTPPVDQDTADIWEAILTLSAKLDALEGK